MKITFKGQEIGKLEEAIRRVIGKILGEEGFRCEGGGATQHITIQELHMQVDVHVPEITGIDDKES